MLGEEKDLRNLLPPTPAELHILLALAGEERHGYGIMREVEERTGGEVRLGPGTLYGAIKRMLTKGLIEESDERSDLELDDRRRRYYRITDFGRRVAGAEAERLEEVVHTARARKLLPSRGPRVLPGGCRVRGAVTGLRARIQGAAGCVSKGVPGCLRAADGADVRGSLPGGAAGRCERARAVVGSNDCGSRVDLAWISRRAPRWRGSTNSGSREGTGRQRCKDAGWH